VKINAHLTYTFMDSPVGRLLLAGDDRGLWQLSFINTTPDIGDAWSFSKNVFQGTRSQLSAYFAGDLHQFEEIPLHLVGTDFQLAVWNILLSIPYGVTWSYGEVARTLAKPGASRAVGNANHANPIAIIVPCHRVIGSDGKLGGYSGGLNVKEKLLALERGK
jgi:methylated-DNA-[protein]-cysteine S-methyltransferase